MNFSSNGIGINLGWYWNQPQMVLESTSMILESTSNDIGINLGRYWNQPHDIGINLGEVRRRSYAPIPPGDLSCIETVHQLLVALFPGPSHPAFHTASDGKLGGAWERG